MGKYDDRTNDEKESKSNIYLSIDHLKKGSYQLNILLNNKVVKSITIIKQY